MTVVEVLEAKMALWVDKARHEWTMAKSNGMFVVSGLKLGEEEVGTD